MKKLANATKLSWHMSKDLRDKIKGYLSSGHVSSYIIRELLETDNIRVRYKAIRRIQNNLRSETIG